MEKIFTYGTLQTPNIQTLVVGRNLGLGTPDKLLGYRMAQLKGVHNDFNIIQPHTGSTVSGVVYEVTADELEKIDKYEGDAYMRVSVTLVSNTRAWIYRDDPKSVYYSKIVVPDDE